MSSPPPPTSEERHLPSPLGRDVEVIMAKHTVRRAVYVAPVLMLIFGIFRGVDGAVAAGVGVLIVVANFLLAGYLLSKSALSSLSMDHAAA